MTLIANSTQDQIGLISGLIGQVPDMTRPYLPHAVSAMIAANALRGIETLSRKGKKMERKLKTIDKKIALLQEIHQRSPSLTLQARINTLQKERGQLTHSIVQAQISIFNLPSLLSATPGDSVWNSLSFLSERLASLRTTIFPELSLATLSDAALHAISVVGASTALLRQTGVIDEDSPMGQSLEYAGFAVNLLQACRSVRNLL